MSIIIAFFCGLCAAILTDAIADYISAKAEQLRIDNDLRRSENKNSPTVNL